MNRKLKIGMALVTIIVSGIAIENHFDQTIVYRCTNRNTKLPVFIKIRTHGALHLITKRYSSIEADYYHPNGETYFYDGTDYDHFDEEVFARGNVFPSYDKKLEKSVFIRPTIHLDLLTGSYTIRLQYYSDDPSDELRHPLQPIDYSIYKCPYPSCEQLVATGFCTKR